MAHHIIRWMFVLLGSIIAESALTADLVALGQLLTPAYMAMNYDRLCQMNPEWHLSAPRGLDGEATNYAQHAKDETIASLTSDQSLVVLRLAADAARAEARRQLQENVVSNDKAADPFALKRGVMAMRRISLLLSSTNMKAIVHRSSRNSTPPNELQNPDMGKTYRRCCAAQYNLRESQSTRAPPSGS